MATYPDRTRILLFFLGSGSSFIRRCRSGFDFADYFQTHCWCLSKYLLKCTKCNCILADPDRICFSKFKRFRIWIGSLLVRSIPVPDLFKCGSGHLWLELGLEFRFRFLGFVTKCLRVRNLRQTFSKYLNWQTRLIKNHEIFEKNHEITKKETKSRDLVINREEWHHWLTYSPMLLF